MKTMHSRLFTYGTLMDPEILSLVTGQRSMGIPATLQGFRRNLVSGEVYPGIRPDPQWQVDGMIYQGITPRSLEHLDRFEGDMYSRERVEVIMSDKRKVKAETYVIRPEYYHRLSNSDWNLDNFLSQGRSLFLTEYAGLQQASDNHSA